GDAGELELYGDAALGKNAGIDAPPHVPYENSDVELAVLQRVLGVLQPPFAELTDERSKRQSCLGQMIFSHARRAAAALDDADAFQFLQPRRQQCRRHQRYAAANVVEPSAARQKLMYAQRGPALGDDLR